MLYSTSPSLILSYCKELGHGNWLPYIENELGYSDRTAGRLMKVANEFSSLNCSTLNNLESSKIIALLDLPVEYREDFAEKYDIDTLTYQKSRFLTS